jgi:(1->4)-alpha-D-glucan 1-alpha-D-glucosylmutase
MATATSTKSTADELLTETLGQLDSRRRLPESTYRLQLHSSFTFRDALGITAYLNDLGITHCYASPYLQARPGSTHGYDIINHNALNPEIGSEEDYTAWTSALHEQGIGQILDIVPNHMGIVANDNAWWRDVLENGQASLYAGYFDISWTASSRPELHGKVLLPLLGEPYGKVLESQQLKLEYAGGAFQIAYFELRLPVSPGSYAALLGHALSDLVGKLDKDSPAMHEYLSILTAVKNLPPRTEIDPVRLAERQREKEVIKRRLGTLTDESSEVRSALGVTLQQYNGKAGEPLSFLLLDELLNDQPYRLSFWRVASDEINYRRFFDINELAALSMDREEVFAATHGLILRLLQEGKVDGVRIDHPDGLYDPRQYLERLQEAYVVSCARRLFETREEYQGQDWPAVERLLRSQIADRRRQRSNGARFRPLYAVVEKILMAGEALPEGWPTYGTTGYDFLNMVNGLMVDGRNEEAFTRTYQDCAQDERPYAETVYRKKFLILQNALASELHMLAHQLDRLAQRDRWSRDFTLNGLRHALRLVIAGFPVYRSYIADEGVREADVRHILRAVQRARPRNPALSRAVFDFIRDTLLLRPRQGLLDDSYVYEQRRFAGKFQQVTAPVMAKGMEDTAFYVYNRLLSLNEVGGDPGRFGVPAADLHRYLQERQARWPWALSSSSTHDTKRSEDVRARLDVLSELPQEWRAAFGRWSALNEPHKTQLEDGPAPDANEEYLFYQTLLGAWPLEPFTNGDRVRFIERVQGFMQKALHEAKVHSSWINPDAAYDEALRQFVARALDPNVSGAFLEDVRGLAARITHYGMFNSLAQTLIKLAAPGVPDTYQGTELWDFSLTDPDNRRPVDYERRRQMLRELREKVSSAGERLPALARELVARKEDGRAKLYLTWRALTCRREHAGLFSSGEYLPLEVIGAKNDFVFAFARRMDRQCAVVAVPRLLATLVPDTERMPLGTDVWQETALALPELPARKLWNIFTGEKLTLSGSAPQRLLLARAFANFPVALFLGET